MTDEKNDNKGKKLPYEPPRLFDLGGGIAHAAAACQSGGSASLACKSGNNATGGACGDGGIPSLLCKVGGIK